MSKKSSESDIVYEITSNGKVMHCECGEKFFQKVLAGDAIWIVQCHACKQQYKRVPSENNKRGPKSS